MTAGGRLILGLIVLGRRAYDDIVQAWPKSDSPMAAVMNRLPKVVFSKSAPAAEWSSARHSPRPVEDEIPELKQEPAPAVGKLD
jgi:dihydrofolate reductase